MQPATVLCTPVQTRAAAGQPTSARRAPPCNRAGGDHNSIAKRSAQNTTTRSASTTQERLSARVADGTPTASVRTPIRSPHPQTGHPTLWAAPTIRVHALMRRNYNSIRNPFEVSRSRIEGLTGMAEATPQISQRHTPSHTHRDRTPGERRGDRAQTGTRTSRHLRRQRRRSPLHRMAPALTQGSAVNAPAPAPAQPARHPDRPSARARTPADHLGVHGDGSRQGDGGVRGGHPVVNVKTVRCPHEDPLSSAARPRLRRDKPVQCRRNKPIAQMLSARDSGKPCARAAPTLSSPQICV